MQGHLQQLAEFLSFSVIKAVNSLKVPQFQQTFQALDCDTILTEWTACELSVSVNYQLYPTISHAVDTAAF